MNNMVTQNQRPDYKRFSAFQEIPQNAWYVAAGTEEVGHEPFGRKLLGKPVVMYRKENGEVVAMRDACPHRGYPLSKSRVKGNNIQCMYHGIVFNDEGQCVDMPAMPGAPKSPNMCVKTYPVVERWHWIWIWMGDPEKADPSLIPFHKCENYDHYDHRFYSPLGPIQCNFMIMHDNLSDASHTSFLHEGLLDDPDNTEMALAEPLVERMDDRNVRVTRIMKNFVPQPAVAQLYGLESGKRYTRTLEVWHHLPGALTAFNRYYPVDENGNEGELAAEHITALGLTPSDERTSFHLTAASTSWEQTDVDKDSLLYVIGQDVVAFEQIQRYFEENYEDAVEVSTTSDKLGIQLRRMMNTLVKNEKSG
jgi:vanillate monooxygenase